MLTALPIFTGAALAATCAASIYYATYAVRSQWLGRTIWRGRSDTASVALTFDDGPSADTERVLDVLDPQINRNEIVDDAERKTLGKVEHGSDGAES